MHISEINSFVNLISKYHCLDVGTEPNQRQDNSVEFIWLYSTHLETSSALINQGDFFDVDQTSLLFTSGVMEINVTQ